MNGNGMVLNGNLHWEGIITNSGMDTAHNVRIDVRWYNQNHNLVSIDNVDIEDVPAQTSKNISFDVSQPNPLATSYELEFFWTP